MHIDYHVQVGDPLTAPQAEKIKKIITKTFEEIDTTFNDWNPSAEISQASKLQAFEKKRLSPSLLALLEKVDTFYIQSGKKFDITIAPLLILYREAFKRGELPSEEKIRAAEKCVGWEKVHIEEGYLWKEESSTSFDLGGIAKGLAVDMLTEKLQEAGFSSTYVEWGGEVRTRGRHPSGRPWRVAIENSPQVIELENEAIATSGDSYQYWKVGEREYFHIIDPQSKKPLEKKVGGISTTSVVAPTCLEADVLATILMLFEDAPQAEEWITTHFPTLEYTLKVR